MSNSGRMFLIVRSISSTVTVVESFFDADQELLVSDSLRFTELVVSCSNVRCAFVFTPLNCLCLSKFIKSNCATDRCFNTHLLSKRLCLRHKRSFELV